MHTPVQDEIRVSKNNHIVSSIQFGTMKWEIVEESLVQVPNSKETLTTCITLPADYLDASKVLPLSRKETSNEAISTHNRCKKVWNSPLSRNLAAWGLDFLYPGWRVLLRNHVSVAWLQVLEHHPPRKESLVLIQETALEALVLLYWWNLRMQSIHWSTIIIAK